MSLLLVGFGVALLTVPALVAHSKLSPPVQVRAACFAAVGGLWVVGIGTFLVASPLLMWWHDGGEVTRLGFSHISPGGPLAWIAGGGLGGLGATWLFGSVRRAIILRQRAALPRWAAGVIHHDDHQDFEVRVAPSSRPIAFAVPGRDRHVVISEGVTQLLTEPELRAVLAHEGAHLRLRHDRHLLILAAYERVWGWLPGVAIVVARHRRAVEQWADTAAIEAHDVDANALPQARQTLAAHHHCFTDPVPPTRRSSRLHLAGLTVTIVALLGGGGYLATHTIDDLTTMLAALH